MNEDNITNESKGLSLEYEYNCKVKLIVKESEFIKRKACVWNCLECEDTRQFVD